jgi:hypothetical protein
VAPHTPWQSPTSRAHARQDPCTSQVRHNATAASAGSLGAGKNVSGSTLWHKPLVRHAGSRSRSLSARSNRGSRLAAATSCGRGIRARVMHPPPPWVTTFRWARAVEKTARPTALCFTALARAQTRGPRRDCGKPSPLIGSYG